VRRFVSNGNSVHTHRKQKGGFRFPCNVSYTGRSKYYIVMKKSGKVKVAVSRALGLVYWGQPVFGPIAKRSNHSVIGEKKNKEKEDSSALTSLGSVMREKRMREGKKVPGGKKTIP